MVGRRIWSFTRQSALRAVDAIGGSVVSVVAVLVVTWFVGYSLSNGPFPTVTKQIRSSAIVQTLNDVLPRPPLVLADVRQFLDRFGFPEVFADLPPIPASPVPVPADKTVRAIAAKADPSVVEVVGDACSEVLSGNRLRRRARLRRHERPRGGRRVRHAGRTVPRREPPRHRRVLRSEDGPGGAVRSVARRPAAAHGRSGGRNAGRRARCSATRGAARSWRWPPRSAGRWRRSAATSTAAPSWRGASTSCRRWSGPGDSGGPFVLARRDGRRRGVRRLDHRSERGVRADVDEGAPAGPAGRRAHCRSGHRRLRPLTLRTPGPARGATLGSARGP